MNFPKWQWCVIVVLDVFVKTALLSFASVFAIGAPIQPLMVFALMGASISSLHFLCIYFSRRFFVRVDLERAKIARPLKFALMLLFASFLFVVSWTAIMSTNGAVYGSAVIGLILAATNLIPVLLIATFGWIYNLTRRLI